MKPLAVWFCPRGEGLTYQMRTVFPVRKGTRSTHLICRHKMPESSARP